MIFFFLFSMRKVEFYNSIHETLSPILCRVHILLTEFVLFGKSCKHYLLNIHLKTCYTCNRENTLLESIETPVKSHTLSQFPSFRASTKQKHRRHFVKKIVSERRIFHRENESHKRRDSITSHVYHAK
jgi:hypothetical protein